jgi:hypothetical protein
LLTSRKTGRISAELLEQLLLLQSIGKLPTDHPLVQHLLEGGASAEGGASSGAEDEEEEDGEGFDLCADGADDSGGNVRSAIDLVGSDSDE